MRVTFYSDMQRADKVDAAALRQWRRVIYRAKTLPAHNLRGGQLPDAWSRVADGSGRRTAVRLYDGTLHIHRMSFWQASCAVMSLL